MPRKVSEWIGKSADAKPPKTVRQRIFDRANGICHLCKLPIKPDETWHLDHVKALILGGENRETNLKPAHAHCNLKKGNKETTIKNKANRQRQKHIGVKDDKPAIPARASRKKSDPKRLTRDPFAGLPRRSLYTL